MLTENELIIISKVLNRFEGEVDFVSTDKYQALKRNVRCELYSTEVRNFYKHIESSMPTSEPHGEDATKVWDEFYEQRWTIGFNGKCIHIENSASIYQAMFDMFKEYIEEEL